jgi:hypothetical protein
MSEKYRALAKLRIGEDWTLDTLKQQIEEMIAQWNDEHEETISEGTIEVSDSYVFCELEASNE